ncbi:uncharacterized protein Bfra_010564ca [Botrytis fragariae]|uniref:Uncharacterized protein n=1 Tax=Botrytis fragariae TaxID=1964551 RepID=A0A8H6AHU5_9HELO|nr:uncharacterized protein Bfra_010564ca [Botrytis fragariae]KAF5867589.1 hypothetical protein Bfra_010564ca [Botrytis fragariae]
MIQGSHSITNPETSQREQVTDFAVKTKGPNARLLRLELRGDEGDDLEAIPMDKRDENSSIFGEEKTLRGVANHVVYGGNINVTFHDAASLTTYQDRSLLKEGESIHMKAIWTFDWLGLEHDLNSSSNTLNSEQPRRQQTWPGRLKAAMVNNEQGWIGKIGKDDPIPDGVQFTRALKKFDLVYGRIEDSIHYEDGVRKGTSGSMRFR